MGAFAGHRPSGGGGEFLKKWKEKGQFDAWFHTKVMPIALWQHKMPTVKSITKEGTTVKHVWSSTFVCHEDEATLEAQYFRDRDTNARKHPPKRCGICKLIEWAYQQCLLFEEFREENEAAIAAGKPKRVKGIRFTTPLFEYEGDIDSEAQVLHIGGICNLFSKDMSPEQKADLKTAKINVGGQTGAWRENAMAKCAYAMCVVNNDRPDDGVQIAVETTALGNAVKDVLNKIVESEDGRAIEEDPYVIRWKFNKEAAMNEMYDALAMLKIKPTPRILKLIRGDAPLEALNKLTQRFNQQLVRTSLESHCVEEMKAIVPWDDLFPTAAQEKAWAAEDAEAEVEAEEAARSGGSGKKSRAAEPDDDDDDDGDDEKKSVADDDDEEEFQCDNPKCLKAVKASDAKCPHCGHVYEVEDEEDEEEEEEAKPAPRLPTRAEALAAKAAKAKGGEKPKSKAKVEKSDADESDDDDDDDDSQNAEIPF